MTKIEILEKIILEEGSCTWARTSVCKICPLGRSSRYDSKSYMSCVEAIGIDGLSEEDADAKYKAAAVSKLADIAIEEAIESD